MKKRILIVGAGVAGKDVVREISNDPKLGLSVVGFIDDDARKLNTLVEKIRVIGSQKNLAKLIKKYRIRQVIIAIPSAAGERIAEYLKICNDKKVDVRIVPRVKEIIEGRARVKTLRKVRVEDLLGRPVVKADVSELKAFFRGKEVLVTGAAGSIGSELSRQIAAYRPKRLVLFDWWENGIFEMKSELTRSFPNLDIESIIGNIQDIDKVQRFLEGEKPNFVFHAAAYKHVPLMEDYPEEAVKNNIWGTFNLVRESVLSGVQKFVLVSTDKAANPRSVMGGTKFITEAIAKYFNQKGKTRLITVRFGNVLDSFGSVVPIFRRQIDEGGPITITDRKMTRYFMSIPEAAQLILKSATMGKGGELFILDMGEPVRILDLAENMIRLSGLIPYEDVDIVFVGRRKGEKIRESLFTKKEKEKLVRTDEQKIFITESQGIDIKNIPSIVKKFRDLAKKDDRVGIRKELSRLIVSFKA